MSYKNMWKSLLLKVKYGFWSYALYLGLTIFFISVYFVTMIQSDAKEFEDMQSLVMLVFLYIPVNLNLMIQTIEYSKCYYLVPRTNEERKRFMVFSNIVKMISSLVLITLVLAISLRFHPEASAYLIRTYLYAGVAFTIALGCNGYGIYRKNKKQQSYKAFMIRYVLSIVLITAVTLAVFAFSKKADSFMGKYGAYIILLLAIGYHGYVYIRFRKTEAVYENIDRNERRIMTRMGSRML